jgi:hypothetical protein
MTMADEQQDDIELVFPEEGTEEAEELGGLEEFGDLEEELEQPFTYDEEAPNLVSQFESHEDGKDALKRIARKVQEDFEAAQKSSEDYRKQIAEDWRTFAGILEVKEFPFKNCANVNVPIMLENCSRLLMRMLSELLGDSTLYSVIPVGPEDDQQAQLMTLHGNWQLMEQIGDFKRQLSRGLLSFIIFGECFWHSYYDHVRRCNRHEVLTPDQLYLAPSIVSTQVDLSDVPFLVKVLFMYRHELQAQEGMWEHVEEVIEKREPSWDDEPGVDDMPLARTVLESSKIDLDVDSEAPYKLLHYEGWLELPDQAQDRYCQVILDTHTMQILRLSIHEEMDWRDRIRFDAQQQQYDEYVAARGAYDAQFDAARDQELSTREALGMAEAVPEGMKAAFIDEAAMGREGMVPPPRPEWMGEGEDMIAPEPMRKVPTHMFTHIVCIENLYGTTGLSFGRIQADFNKGANTAMNQFVDAATLGNCWTFLVSGDFAPKGKDGVEFKPGKFNRIEGLSGDDIRKSIMELKPEPANPQLLQLVDKLFAYGQSSIQAPNVLSGEPGKSGETYRGISTRIDQATKQLSVSTKNFADGLNNVIRNNARLNAIFLPEQELVSMTDTMEGRIVAQTVGRKMYERNYRIKFTSDFKFSSQAQRISEADEILQMPAAVPPLQQNMAFLWEAVKGSLIARGRADLVKFLGPPPPPPETPFGIPPPPPPGMEPPPGAPPGPPGGEPPPEGAPA